MSGMIGSKVRVGVLDDGGEARWDAFVERCPEATFFHRAGWRRVLERSFGHACHFLYAERAGEIVGVLPLTHVRSRLFSNALISNALCVYGGPAAADEAARQALDAHAVELAGKLGVDYLEYRCRAPMHPDRPRNADLYVTFRKALDPDPERNLLAVPRKQRAMVRKGIKLGLKGETDLDVERFYRLYAASVRNLGTPVFPKAYFRNLRDAFGDDCEVLTVVGPGGRPLAGVMSFYFRDEVLPYYGGGTAAARTVAANDFMYWEVMRAACERGCRVFDFGRSKRGTGAFAFKRNWGFEPEPLHYEYVLLRGEIPSVNPTNPRYRALIAMWKRLPLPVANFLGPYVTRHLG